MKPSPAHSRLVLRSRIGIIAAFVIAISAPASAQTVPQLASTIQTSKSEKARIAAVVSLGKARDPRSLKPLVLALKDDSNVVRSVAATALGHLRDNRALPALRRASRDDDKTVRKRAVQAIAMIQSGQKAPAVLPSRSKRAAHYRIDGREGPRVLGSKPEIFVVLKSATDDSPEKLKKAVRARRQSALKSLVAMELDSSRRVTKSQTTAQTLGLKPYMIDVSIMKLRREVRGKFVEIACELRIAISNERGKMISILTGGAKVQVPRRTFRRAYETQMKREALQNAVKSVNQDLLAYLGRNPV